MKEGKVEMSLNRVDCLGMAKDRLERAKESSKFVSKDAHASKIIRSAIRDIARFLDDADATLSDIGTNKEELKKLIAPPELKLTPEEVENLWKWIIEGDENEKLTPAPELRD